MKRRIDERIGHKFATAAGILMTRVFSSPPQANQRRLAFAAGPASTGGRIATPDPASRFDVVGLGFVSGREWRGPAEIFVEEQRDGEARIWRNCRFWTDSDASPFYLLTQTPEVSFSYDGYSLVLLSGEPGHVEEGVRLASERLREGARLLPNDIERHRMM